VPGQLDLSYGGRGSRRQRHLGGKASGGPDVARITLQRDEAFGRLEHGFRVGKGCCARRASLGAARQHVGR